jgi:hypothetical protein
VNDPVVNLAAEQAKLNAKRKRLGLDRDDPEPDTPARFPKIRGPHEETATPSSRRPTSPRARGRHPVVEDEPAAEDPGYPLIPEGEYQAVLKHCSLEQLWSRWVWICWFQISTGEHQGAEVPFYMTKPTDEKSRRMRRGWKVSTTYAVATGRRPPKNIARLNPKTYLAEKVFLVKVGAVPTDFQGNEVPEAARYSKIKTLVRPLTGQGSGS